MILRKIVLENFVSHDNTKLQFTEGIIAIVGPNGAGKTSILDAISFALYKEHSRGGTLENIIKRGAGKATVVLEFEAKGRLYKVERRVMKSGRSVKSDVRVYENNTLKAYTDSEANKLLEQIIGMDKTLFLNSIYIRQGEIEKLVTARPAERKQIIARLMGIEDLEKAFQEMREVIKPFENKSHELYGRLKAKDEIIKLLVEKNSLLNSKRKELEKARRELNDVQNKYRALEKALSEYDAKATKFVEYKSRLENIRKRITDINSRLDNFNEEYSKALEAAKKLAILEPKLAIMDVLKEYLALKERENIFSERVEELKKKRQEIEEHRRFIDNNRDIEEKYNRLKSLEKEFKEILSQHSNLLGRLKEIQRQIMELQASIETIQKRFEDTLHMLINTVPEEFVSLLRGSEYTITSFSSNLEKIMDHLSKDMERMEHDIEFLKNKKLKINYSLEEIAANIKEISTSSQCPLCHSKLTPEHRDELLKDLFNTKRELEKLLQNLEEEEKDKIRRHEFLRNTLEKLESVFKGKLMLLSEKYKEYNLRFDNLKGERENIRLELEVLEEEKKSIQKKLESLEEIERNYRRFLLAKEYLEKVNEEEINTNLRNLSRELSNVKAKISLIEQEHAEEVKDAEKRIDYYRELEKEVSELRSIVAKIPFLKDIIAKLEDEKRLLQETMQAIQKDLEDLGYDENTHLQLKEEEARLRDLEKRLLSKTSSLEADILNLKNEILDLERKLNEIGRIEEEYARLNDFIGFLRKIRKLYGKEGLQKIVRRRARPLLELHTKQIFQHLNYVNFVDIRLDDNYEITLVTPRGDETADMISGGERVGLALALRLAIARVLAGDKVGFLLLDEPTTHLDEERRRYLVGLLKKFFKEKGGIIPQLIIVTHERELEDAADLVYKVEKKGGTSHVFLEAEPIS
ncbi:MAG: AAA family ATPase [Thermoproteales archaeon]|nr:AAA family ATPase [Thermoproteales archaeon]